MLETAVAAFIGLAEGGQAQLLYSVYYEQMPDPVSSVLSISATALDLAFNDEILEAVHTDWKKIMGKDVDDAEFMRFEDRSGMNDDDDNNDNVY